MSKRVNSEWLRDWLLQVHRPTIITLQTATVPRMRKTGNPYYGKTIKHARFQGMVCFQYDNGVLRRLAKEGKDPTVFRRGDSWHEPVLIKGRLTPLCWHKDPDSRGDGHIRLMYLKSLKDSVYTDLAGAPIDMAVLTPFLSDRSSYSNQGLDKPLVFITPEIRNVIEITIEGETFTLR